MKATTMLQKCWLKCCGRPTEMVTDPERCLRQKRLREREVGSTAGLFAVLSLGSSLFTAPSATQGVACGSQVDNRPPEQLNTLGFNSTWQPVCQGFMHSHSWVKRRGALEFRTKCWTSPKTLPRELHTSPKTLPRELHDVHLTMRQVKTCLTLVQKHTNELHRRRWYSP